MDEWPPKDCERDVILANDVKKRSPDNTSINENRHRLTFILFQPGKGAEPDP